MYVCGCWHVGKPEDSMLELSLPFSHMDSRGHTPVVRLSGSHLYQLICHATPSFFINWFIKTVLIGDFAIF